MGRGRETQPHEAEKYTGISKFNPLTIGAVHTRFLHFHIIAQLLNMLKIKSDINQQDWKFVDLHFVKSE